MLMKDVKEPKFDTIHFVKELVIAYALLAIACRAARSGTEKLK